MPMYLKASYSIHIDNRRWSAYGVGEMTYLIILFCCAGLVLLAIEESNPRDQPKDLVVMINLPSKQAVVAGCGVVWCVRACGLTVMWTALRTFQISINSPTPELLRINQLVSYTTAQHIATHSSSQFHFSYIVQEIEENDELTADGQEHCAHRYPHKRLALLPE